MSKETATYKSLLSIYKKPIIKVHEAGAFFDMRPKTVNNRIHQGTFFLPTFKVGNNRFVRLEDMANYIDEATKRSELERQAFRAAVGKRTY